MIGANFLFGTLAGGVFLLLVLMIVGMRQKLRQQQRQLEQLLGNAGQLAEIAKQKELEAVALREAIGKFQGPMQLQLQTDQMAAIANIVAQILKSQNVVMFPRSPGETVH